MKLKIMSLAMFAALLGAFVLAPISVGAEGTGSGLLVTATKNDGTKNFNGTWVLNEFVVQGDTIFAAGQLTGNVTNKNGKVTNSINETVLLPVIDASSDA